MQEIFLLQDAQTGLVPTQSQALFLGGEADMRLTICLPIVLRLRMNAILRPVFLYAFMACTQTTLPSSQCVHLGSSCILLIILFLVL